MSNLQSFQKTQFEFAAHLRDPEQNPGPSDIEDRRLKIYRDLIFKNIESFLASGFPILRSLINDEDWNRVVRDFVSHHQSHTPYFLEISEEFLQYLQEECQCLPKNLPFALELAHYEWVELALDVSPEAFPEHTNPSDDVLNNRLQVSPLAWRLSYQYPVHKLGASYQPQTPPEQPTSLVVYRDREHQVKFLESNPVTLRLLQLLDDDANLTGQEALTSIASELKSDVDSILSFGTPLLEQLLRLDILFI